jgi:hypothetical protein
METYCNKLEAKNTELEFMVKTLQRSIEQHEQSSDNPSTSHVNTTTNSDINFIVPFGHIVSSCAHFSHFFIAVGVNLICCLTSTVHLKY